MPVILVVAWALHPVLAVLGVVSVVLGPLLGFSLRLVLVLILLVPAPAVVSLLALALLAMLSPLVFVPILVFVVPRVISCHDVINCAGG